MIKNIIVLGGSGYLGNAIAKRFKNDSRYTIAIGDLEKPKNTDLDFVQVDVLNKSLIDDAIKAYDLIINCTGQITNPLNVCFTVNTEGIDNIVEAVKINNKKLFHISTLAIYGSTRYADEQSQINPESPYATCKAFAEYCIKLNLAEIKYCILRIPNLYGKNQPKGLFAYLSKSLRSNKKLYFNNDGSLTRYFLHVSDCAEAIYSSVNTDLAGTYNLPSYDKYNLKEIISFVEDKLEIQFEKEFASIKPIENIDKINFSLFIEKTKFEPKVKLDDFIDKEFS
jgi:Nucleoside-diphosphate-sugar epimerases